MKKFGIIISWFTLVFYAMIMTTAYAAENSKIAVVDFTRVIEESNYGKTANAELTEWVKTRQNTLDEMKKMLKN